MRVALLLLILLAGCSQIVCNTPYIQVGDSCCLDENDNSICDKDESVESNTNIVVSKPAKTITQKVYVCDDGSEVESKEECIAKEQPIVDEKPKLTLPTPRLDNEKFSVIDKVSVDPACVRGLQGGEVYFKTGTVPVNIDFQIKEIGKNSFEHIHRRDGSYEGYTRFAICDDCKTGEFQLKEDTVYTMRVMFNQTPIYDRLEYSNEHIIDTRLDSDYRLKVCSR